MPSCEGVEQVKGMVADVGTDESGQPVASMSASGYVPMGKTHRCGGPRPDESVGVSGIVECSVVALQGRSVRESL